MFPFFDLISGLIDMIVDTFTYFTSAVVQFFAYISSGVLFITATIAVLPPFCRGIIGVVFGVSVLSVILSKFVDLG